MDSNYEKMLEQQVLVLNKLNGDAKKEFYTNLFNACIINSLVLKRKKDNISQTEIAKAMGVKQSYVSKIEHLIKVPTIETIAKYCFALNFEILEVRKIAKEIANRQDAFPNLINYYEEQGDWNNKKNNNLLRLEKNSGICYNL